MNGDDSITMWSRLCSLKVEQLGEALADNARLRALVKEAEWAFDDGYCSWCKANIEPGNHDPDCPAFNPDGSVK